MLDVDFRFVENRGEYARSMDKVRKSYIAALRSESLRAKEKKNRETPEWFAKEIDRTQYNMLKFCLALALNSKDIRAQISLRNVKKYFDEIQQRAYDKYSRQEIADAMFKVVAQNKTMSDLMR